MAFEFIMGLKSILINKQDGNWTPLHQATSESTCDFGTEFLDFLLNQRFFRL